jgi:hypothetical protein
LLNKHVYCFNSLEMASGLDNLNGSHLINHDDLQGLSSHCQGEFDPNLYLIICSYLKYILYVFGYKILSAHVYF